MQRTFNDIKNDIEIDVDQSPGTDDPRFSIIFGSHLLHNEAMVEVTIYKSPLDNSYNAVVSDRCGVLGADFQPSREFIMYCVSLLVSKCSILNAPDDFIVEEARLSDLKKLVESGKITSVDEAKQFFPTLWDGDIKDIFEAQCH